MNIYKILVKHFAQKGSHESIECLLLASSDEEVYKWLNVKLYGYFSDREQDSEFDIYDENYNVIGKENYKDRMLRIKGELFDEEIALDDLYYGKSLYGWELLKTTDIKKTITCLDELGVLEKAN